MSHYIRYISSQPVSFNFSKFNQFFQVHMKPTYILLHLILYHFKINQSGKVRSKKEKNIYLSFHANLFKTQTFALGVPKHDSQANLPIRQVI